MSGRKFNIREMDFNQAGQWSSAVKAIFCGAVIVLIGVLAWLLLTSGKRDELVSLESKEKGLREKYEVVAIQSANLEPLKAQMGQLQQSLQAAVRQLPSKTEMPNMIMDISQTAVGSGLQNELFQPKAETLQEFYAETPISVRMVGQYHQFGDFVGSIASLPRLVIMTMEDITLAPRKGEKTLPKAVEGGTFGETEDINQALELTTTIKTYRYLDEDETQEQEKKAAEAAAAARKAKAKPAGKPKDKAADAGEEA